MAQNNVQNVIRRYSTLTLFILLLLLFCVHNPPRASYPRVLILLYCLQLQPISALSKMKTRIVYDVLLPNLDIGFLLAADQHKYSLSGYNPRRGGARLHPVSYWTVHG